MTGVEFFQYLNQSIDKAYSAYLAPAEANRLIKTALHNLAEKIYRGLIEQKSYDDIDTMIVTGLTKTPLRDQINLFPFQIQNVTLTGGGTLVTITTYRRHFLANNDVVIVSGILGTTVTNINGTQTVATIVSDTSFTYTVVGGVLTNYTATTGEVTHSSTLDNYWHLLAIKPVFTDGTTRTVTGAKSGSTTEITVVNHNLRTGDLVTVASIGGISAAFTDNMPVTVVNKNVFSVAVSSSGSYTSGGTVTRTVSEYATPYIPDRKKSVLYSPTSSDPRAETAEGFIRIYPTGASSVEMDYIREPYFSIDCENATIDLELFYKFKTLQLLVSECTYIFGDESRSEQIANSALQDIALNP